MSDLSNFCTSLKTADDVFDVFSFFFLSILSCLVSLLFIVFCAASNVSSVSVLVLFVFISVSCLSAFLLLPSFSSLVSVSFFLIELFSNFPFSISLDSLSAIFPSCDFFSISFSLEALSIDPTFDFSTSFVLSNFSSFILSSVFSSSTLSSVFS